MENYAEVKKNKTDLYELLCKDSWDTVSEKNKAWNSIYRNICEYHICFHTQELSWKLRNNSGCLGELKARSMTYFTFWTILTFFHIHNVSLFIFNSRVIKIYNLITFLTVL